MKFYEKLISDHDPTLGLPRHMVPPTVAALLHYQQGWLDRSQLISLGETEAGEETDDFNELLDYFDTFAADKAAQFRLIQSWHILTRAGEYGVGDPEALMPDAATLRARMLAVVP